MEIKEKYEREIGYVKDAIGTIVVSVIGVIVSINKFSGSSDKKIVLGMIAFLFGLMSVISAVALIGYVNKAREYKKEMNN